MADEPYRLNLHVPNSVTVNTGEDLQRHLQKIDAFGADKVCKLITSDRGDFENEVAWVWEKIRKYINMSQEGGDLTEEEWSELEGKLKYWYQTVQDLDLSLGSPSETIKKLDDTFKNFKKSKHEKSVRKDSCVFHYADLFGLEPYCLPNRTPLANCAVEDRLMTADDFARSIVEALRFVRSELELKPDIVTSQEMILLNEISYIVNCLKEMGQVQANHNKDHNKHYKELVTKVKMLTNRYTDFKKYQPSYVEYLAATSALLETVDLKRVKVARQFLDKDLEELDWKLMEMGKGADKKQEPASWKPMELQFADPMSDEEFNSELYDFASAGRSDLEDAEIVRWVEDLGFFPHSSGPMPRDLIKRLTPSEEAILAGDYDNWEYSAVHSKGDENGAILDCFLQHFSTVLQESSMNSLFELPEEGSVDAITAAQFNRKVQNGEIQINVNRLLKIHPVFNPFSFVAVRDEDTGKIVDYKVGLKNIELREREYCLRGQIGRWVDDTRPDTHRLRKYGWEPPGCQVDEEEDEEEEEEEAINAKPNEQKKRKRDFEDNVDKNSLNQEINELVQTISEKKLIDDNKQTPLMDKARSCMEELGIKDARLPDCEDVEEFLYALDLPFFNCKDDAKVFRGETLKVEGRLEQLIDEAFADVQGVCDEEKKNEDFTPLSYDVNSTSLFQETMAKLEELAEKENPDGKGECLIFKEESMGEKNTAIKDYLLAQDKENVGFVQGHPKCEELNKKFTEEWVKRHGDKKGLYKTLPEEKEAGARFRMNVESYERDFLTYPYYSTNVFQPDAILIRRVLSEIPEYSNLAFSGTTGLSLADQEKILDDIDSCRDGECSDSSLYNEFNRDDTKLLAYLKKGEFVAANDKGIDEINQFLQDIKSDIPDNCEDFDVDQNYWDNLDNTLIPEYIKRINLVKEPFQFNEGIKEPLSEFELDSDFESECSSTGENMHVSKYLKGNNYKNAKIADNITDWTSDEESDDEEERVNTYTWAPFKQFNEYKGFKIGDSLKLALCLLNTSNEKRYKERRMEIVNLWIMENFDVSYEKLQKWVLEFKEDMPHHLDPFDHPLPEDEAELAKEGGVEKLLSKFKPLGRDLTREEKEEQEEMERTARFESDGLLLYEKVEKEHDENLKMCDIGRCEEPDDSDVIKLGEEKATALGGSVSKILYKGAYAVQANTYNPVDMSFIKQPALTFPFDLDNFQKRAILALEQSYHVFVAAHTSAGKTVVAEYAIAMAKRNQTRAIYTSPVKALSNQKFHDFSKKFKDISVGLITGDTQLNESARCLIMTTEILRSMLYNSSEKIHDLEFVIFDEVHYLNDPERGHVWEECLILLPSRVKIVMLSATVPNAIEFSTWIGRTKRRLVTVCTTNHRPVPLKHYLYMSSEQSKHSHISDMSCLLKVADGKLNRANYDKFMQICETDNAQSMKEKLAVKKAESAKRYKDSKRNYKDDPDMEQIRRKRDEMLWTRLIYMLKSADLMPVVVFIFSRKKCDELASLCRVNLTTSREKWSILTFLKMHIKKLDEDDQKLEQISVMKELLERGIGVHHSGVLPILKEIVESLFHQGIVKVLFTTETFAMGVNMPARTVVFNTIEKFDGSNKRLLTPAEYIQMAGRAGRRGKDMEGNVYIMNWPKQVIPFHHLQTVMEGNPTKLTSQFRIFYRMILITLAKREMITVDAMMANSFRENDQQLKKNDYKADYEKYGIRAQVYEIDIDTTMSEQTKSMLSNFYDQADKFFSVWYKDKENFIGKLELEEGRFVKVTFKNEINRIGIILEVKRPTRDTVNYIVIMLKAHVKVYTDIAPKDESKFTEKELNRWYKMVSMLPCFHFLQPFSEDCYFIATIKATDIFEVYNVKYKREELHMAYSYIKRMPKNSYGNKNLPSQVANLCNNLFFANPNNMQTFTVLFRKTDMDHWDFLAKLKYLSGQLTIAASALTYADFQNHFEKVFLWKEALKNKNETRDILENLQNKALYSNMINVLKEKDYIDENESVKTKGYIAARISKYELVVCEMLIDNILFDLEPPEVAALLSFLVHENKDKNDDDSDISDDMIIAVLPPRLTKAVNRVKEIIKDIEQCERRNGIDDASGCEVFRFSFGITNIIYCWAQQMKFTDILKLPEASQFQEGILVRRIQQLLEMLKAVESAAKVMGDPTILEKIHAASQTIKRGIVFAPSLYTKGFNEEKEEE
ncbi:uncharacterized protein LOC106670824 [Cimex lectularius]|uniref:Helicase n=1 Tax=Cimex lectularius TaxID=79782 RepID=A0A8I6TJT4_CIMLE|nr:uncharacterized protein LOC106670824 [Cimex lectularius]